MSRTSKVVIIVVGFLTALLIVSQVVMALLILQDPGNGGLRKAHQHSGYLLAVVSLVYVTSSLIAIRAIPTRPKS